MAKKKQSEYDTCQDCTHTVNIHIGEDDSCEAYECRCKNFQY